MFSPDGKRQIKKKSSGYNEEPFTPTLEGREAISSAALFATTLSPAICALMRGSLNTNKWSGVGHAPFEHIKLLITLKFLCLGAKYALFICTPLYIPGCFHSFRSLEQPLYAYTLFLLVN